MKNFTQILIIWGSQIEIYTRDDTGPHNMTSWKKLERIRIRRLNLFFSNDDIYEILKDLNEYENLQ